MDNKNLKQELFNILHHNGIPEFDITLKSYKNNPKDNLGCYVALSQLKSRPIIKIDIEAHRKCILEEIKDCEENTNVIENKLKNAVIDTLCHEYGHVIEEFIRMNSTKENNQLLKKIKDNFYDMEDFAESFAYLLNNRKSYLSEKQIETFQECIKFYIKNTFEEISIKWVQQEKWKRELDYLLDSNEKSFLKYQTMDGAFDSCKKVSESVSQRLSKIPGVDVKILKLEGYKGIVKNPKWKKIGNEFIVHYVMLFNDKWTVDLTAKQFDENNSARLIMPLNELELKWNEINIVKTPKTVSFLKK